MLWEIVDNSVDEFLAGECDKIGVTLHKDGSSITVTVNAWTTSFAVNRSAVSRVIPTPSSELVLSQSKSLRARSRRSASAPGRTAWAVTAIRP